MYKLLISGAIVSGAIVSGAIYLYNKRPSTNKLHEFDMIIGPGGYNGFYILGICHYIRNTYDLTNVKMIGFSAGAITIIFMSLPNMIINDYLRKLFKHEITSDIALLVNNIFTDMKNILKYDELDMTNKCIGLTTSSYTLDVYRSFISINDVVNCCQASSFIPMLTHRSPLYYYNGDAYFDGALSYWKLKKSCKKGTLIISYRMFGRYRGCIANGLTYNKHMSVYNMYMLGYHDAMNNKDYLDTFFNLNL